MTTDADSTTLIPGAHRSIRTLPEGEGPFRGMLVSTGDSVAVKVSADSLGGWAGWSYAGCEHVAAPLDLVRRSDGHDVLLPWCTQTVDAYLGRREAIGAPLSVGEVSTLVVSLLRGIGEMRADGDTGRWWLTDESRPVFVIGEGKDVREAAAAIIDRMRNDVNDRMLARFLLAVHDGLVAGIDRPQMPAAQLDRWEREMFEVAAPRALSTSLHAPERVRELDLLRASREQTPVTRRVARRVRAGETRRQSGTLKNRVPQVITRVSDGARAVGAALRERMHRHPRSERAAAASTPRRKIVISVAAAAVVITGGLLWPGGATGESSATPGPQTTPLGAVDAEQTASTAPEPSTSPSPGVPEVASEDPVAVVPELLAGVERCVSGGDGVCPDAVAEGSGGVVDALQTIATAVDAPTVTLVDEYGDVAVIRAGTAATEDAEAREVMLVLVRLNDKWLVRDVYDVADQP